MGLGFANLPSPARDERIFLPSLTGLLSFQNAQPSHEWLGYFHSSAKPTCSFAPATSNRRRCNSSLKTPAKRRSCAGSPCGRLPITAGATPRPTVVLDTQTTGANCKATLSHYRTTLLDNGKTVLDYKTIMLNYKATLFDYKATLHDCTMTLFDYKATLFDCTMTLFDSKATLLNCKTTLHDCKATLFDSKMTLFDSKTILLDCKTILQNSKTIWKATKISGLDGKTAESALPGTCL